MIQVFIHIKGICFQTCHKKKYITYSHITITPSTSSEPPQSIDEKEFLTMPRSTLVSQGSLIPSRRSTCVQRWSKQSCQTVMIGSTGRIRTAMARWLVPGRMSHLDLYKTIWS